MVTTIGALDGILAIVIGLMLVPFDMVRRYWEKEAAWLFKDAEGDSLWGLEERMLARGKAYRSELSAQAASIATRACPMIAAPFAAVAVLGSAYAQATLVASSTIILGAVWMVGNRLFDIWLHRRVDAFDVFFYSRNPMQFIYNRNRTAELFYRLNHVPPESVFDRGWFDRIKLPSVDDVAAYASLSKFPNVELPASYETELSEPDDRTHYRP